LSAYDHILNERKISASNTKVHCSSPLIRFESIMLCSPDGWTLVNLPYELHEWVVQPHYTYRKNVGST
ncbi:MAG: hypothetical protein JW902_09975, partial [Syntrophaceae bacterium]|nr:hypothetical protein [Syntrophaceae bacterium]